MGVINYTTAQINDFLKKVEEAPEKLENGKTPVFITGTTTTLDPGLSATAEVVLVGTDSEGNPQYKINFGVPKGLDGAGGSGGGVADSVQWANVLNKPSWVNSATKPSYTASEVGALPAGTFIPTKTSDIENDRGFLTSDNFKTINGQSIVGEGNITIQEGGGSSGGAGNVNVTNVSTLRNNRLYSFKPSEDGSSVGVFSELPNAGMTNDGLMTSADYEKLITLKPCVYLPIAFEQVNSSTTKEELISLFNNIPEISIENYSTLVYFFMLLCSASNGEGSVDVYKFYIGNNDCFFRGTYSEDGTNLQADFTYIAIGGKLRTISINMSNIDSSDMSSADLAISVTESGSDKIYLSEDIFSLTSESTKEEVFSAFGGEEMFKSLFVNKDNSGKSFFILHHTSGNLFWFSKPAFVECQFIFAYTVSIVTFENDSLKNDNKIKCLFFILNASLTELTKIENYTYPLKGYALNYSFYSLQKGSSSADISSAVGGEAGLKSIINNIKAGNRLRIAGTEGDTSISSDLSVWCYSIMENGDMVLAFVGFGYGIFGTSLGGLLTIKFTKSTNEFAADVFPLSFQS